MGIVYRATDLATGRTVAVKALRSADDEAEKRFLREAEVLAALRHPGIVEYVAHGVADGEPFLAMEWLEGASLKEVLEERGLGLVEIIEVAEAVGAALAFAHARGVVHRDLKPANVFLVQKATRLAKVVDFGIAQLRGSETLTGTGAMLGTPAYMSPEQVTKARHVDARSDLFSLGAVLFRCVAGRAPFQMEEAVQTILALSTTRAPPVRSFAPGVPPRLGAIIDALLGKEPFERPPDAATVLRMLADARAEIGSFNWSSLPVSSTVSMGSSRSAPGTTIRESAVAKSFNAQPLPPRSTPLGWILGGVLTLGIGGAIAVYFFAASPARKKTSTDSDDSPRAASSSQPTSSPSHSASPTFVSVKSNWCALRAFDCVKLDIPDITHADVEQVIRLGLDYGRKKRPYAALYAVSAMGMTDGGIDLTSMDGSVEVRFQDCSVSIDHDVMSIQDDENLPPAPPPHCTLSEAYKSARAYGLPAGMAIGRANNTEVVFITQNAKPEVTVKLSGTTCKPFSKQP